MGLLKRKMEVGEIKHVHRKHKCSGEELEFLKIYEESGERK